MLVPRQDLTGADRTQAHRYQEGDVRRYAQGSAARGLAAGDYARVVHVDAAANQLTVRRSTGATVTDDPQRLQGVSVYRDAERSFAVGCSSPRRFAISTSPTASSGPSRRSRPAP